MMPLPSEKRCSACKDYKPLAEFSADPNTKLGFKAACKSCESARHRAYYIRRQAEKGPRNRGTGRPVEVPWPLPTHDILQSLSCVQLRKWRGPVNRCEPMRAKL